MSILACFGSAIPGYHMATGPRRNSCHPIIAPRALEVCRIPGE
ncbi:MAG TPA: hypothetical protein PK272_04490 [Methanoregulaceae archaeon]|nr:hypothetical protein [Methanoregulaceae archaeon]